MTAVSDPTRPARGDPPSRAAALASVHFAVLLFGGAGLFGKIIDLGPLEIVAGRVFFASVVLGALLRFRGDRLKPDGAGEVVGLAGLGALLAVHWVTFFHSIQISSVAVGLVTFSTAPVFAALIEPLREPGGWSARDLAAAAICTAGVALVVPELDWSSDMTRGAVWGVVSGLTFALLSIANRGYVQRHSPLVVALHQDVWALLLLAPVVALRPGASLPGATSWGLLMLLGTVFTALAHTLFLNSLRSVRASTANVVATLEPVYGVILALLLLGEEPTSGTLSGGALIVGAAAWVSLRPSQSTATLGSHV